MDVTGVKYMSFIGLRLGFALSRLITRDIRAGNFLKAAERQRLSYNILSEVTCQS